MPIDATIMLSVKEPMFMDTFIACGHLTCALFGILLNMTIILFIIFCRRLRRQPRNIIWIAIGFANIFVLFTNILEPIWFAYSTEAYTAELLCRIHFFLVGFPGAAFLMNNCISLADRYISIFHSVWYRRCVTVRLVLTIQLGTSIFLFFLMKSHYIFGHIQVKCNVVPPLDRTVYIGFISLFLILCLSGQLTLFILVKRHLGLSTADKQGSTNGGNDTTTNAEEESLGRNMIPQNGPTTSSNHQTDNVFSPEEAVNALNSHAAESKSFRIKKSLHFVRIRDQMVSRLELEATRNVIVSVGIMLLFTLPWIIASVLAHICSGNVNRDAIGDAEDEETTEPLDAVGQCSAYYWAISYTRLILLVGHSIYQSVCYVKRSKYFCAALCRVHRGRRRCSNGCCAGANIQQPAETVRYQQPHHRMKKMKRHRYNRQSDTAHQKFEHSPGQ